MQLDKEYPATHSMSTSWYIVDEDDNVAILDMNENGPVPWGTPEESIESLVLGYCDEGGKKGKFYPVKLMPDQVKLLLSEPHNPEEYDRWYDCIVEIDADKKEEFLLLARNKDCDKVCCISEDLNLYHICSDDAVVDENGGGWHVRIRSSIKKMLDSHIILNVYEIKDFYIDDRYNDEGELVEYEKEWDNCPYYIYAEPYWTDCLSKRLNIPDNPIKLSQMPRELHNRIIRIPGRFDDREFLQIANYAPCVISSKETLIAYDCEYELVPQEDGSEIYILSNLFPWDIYSVHRGKYDTQLCAYPTVLIIDGLIHARYYNMQTSLEDIFRYALQVSFLNFEWIERIIEKFQPNVVLFKGGAEKAMSDIISLNDHLITICGKSYPVYLYKDRKKYRNLIMALAGNPYRGKQYPFRISKEEMERLKLAGKAYTYSEYLY